MVNQLVEATTKARTRDIRIQRDGPRLVSFTIVVTHDDPVDVKPSSNKLRRIMTVGSVGALRGLFDQILKQSGAGEKIDNPELWRNPSGRLFRSASRSASKSDFYTSKSMLSRNSYKTAATRSGHQPEIKIKRLDQYVQ